MPSLPRGLSDGEDRHTLGLYVPVVQQPVFADTRL